VTTIAATVPMTTPSRLRRRPCASTIRRMSRRALHWPVGGRISRFAADTDQAITPYRRSRRGREATAAKPAISRAVFAPLRERVGDHLSRVRMLVGGQVRDRWRRPLRRSLAKLVRIALACGRLTTTVLRGSLQIRAVEEQERTASTRAGACIGRYAHESQRDLEAVK